VVSCRNRQPGDEVINNGPNCSLPPEGRVASSEDAESGSECKYGKTKPVYFVNEVRPCNGREWFLVFEGVRNKIVRDDVLLDDVDSGGRHDEEG